MEEVAVEIIGKASVYIDCSCALFNATRFPILHYRTDALVGK